MSTYRSLLLVLRFTFNTTADRLGDEWSVKFACGWASCSFWDDTTFIRLVSLFVTDVASSLEALVLAFLVLASVPQVSPSASSLWK